MNVKNLLKGLKPEGRENLVKSLIDDRDELASFLIELSPYAKKTLNKKNGSGARSFNQIVDILIAMGYQKALEREDRNQFRYAQHPTLGDWVGGKFERERFGL